MQIKTKFHGTIEFREKDIIRFEKGLPGFESLKNYIISEIEDTSFFLLHSIDDMEIGIVVANPFDFNSKYNVNLEDNIISKLKIEAEEDVRIYTTVTVDSDGKKITSNFTAPIIVNIKESLGEQIILNDSKYKIKQPLL